MLDVRSALRRSAAFHADRNAILSGGDRLTYGQAWDGEAARRTRT